MLFYYYIEFLPYADRCRFNTCTHFYKPDCAAIEVVKDGKIPEIRYDSYLKMLETIEEDIIYK